MASTPTRRIDRYPAAAASTRRFRSEGKSGAYAALPTSPSSSGFTGFGSAKMLP